MVCPIWGCRTSPWSHISVRLTLGASTKAARITVGYLRSYDNISATAYWINDRVRQLRHCFEPISHARISQLRATRAPCDRL